MLNLAIGQLQYIPKPESFGPFFWGGISLTITTSLAGDLVVICPMVTSLQRNTGKFHLL